MARYAGSQGKGPKKSRRDKLKASVHSRSEANYYGNGQARTQIRRYNDGDPTLVHTDRAKDGTKTTTRVKADKYANPIKKGVKGVKGLPAVSRNKSEYKTNAARKSVNKTAASEVRKHGGFETKSKATHHLGTSKKKKKK
jgi:hypothetical protein